MTARSEFYDHARKRGEERVFVLAHTFCDDPHLFVDAFGDPAIPDELKTKEDRMFHLFKFCCNVVASDWTWTIDFSDGDVEICAVTI